MGSRPHLFAVASAVIALLGSTAAPMAPASTGPEAPTSLSSRQPQQQLPLSPDRGSGLAVTPAYEGWYRNPDGSYSLSFGYYNRNRDEVVEIPLGEHNVMEPAELNGMQPTRFEPRRHWGVFVVRLPADAPPDSRVVWTIEFRGQRYSIPGHLHIDWQIDALQGEAGAGNTPPRLRFEGDGPEGAGPAGVMAEPMVARVGEPLQLTVWVSDDGVRDPSIASGGRENVPVTLSWFKHQGPGEVTFAEESGQAPVTGGEMATTATFSAPGEYLLRVRANDSSGVSGAGHAQCCWTNGYVWVSVGGAQDRSER